MMRTMSNAFKTLMKPVISKKNVVGDIRGKVMRQNI
jgi:hypothetical protein